MCSSTALAAGAAVPPPVDQRSPLSPVRTSRTARWHIGELAAGAKPRMAGDEQGDLHRVGTRLRLQREREGQDRGNGREPGQPGDEADGSGDGRHRGGLGGLEHLHLKDTSGVPRQ